MKYWKKPNGRKGLVLLRCAVFLTVLAAALLSVQFVLVKKFQREDCWPQRYRDYAAGQTPDLVIIGNSQLYWGLDPMVLYNEAGITSVNMSGVLYHHTLALEQLKTLLSLNSAPEYVLFSPASLVRFFSADDAKAEPAYFQFITNQPTLRRKLEAFRAMKAEAEQGVDAASWVFPLLRYHERWTELSGDDFAPDSEYEAVYKPYLKGHYPYLESLDIREFAETEEENTGFEGVNEKAAAGWEEFLALCSESGITPVAVLLPRFDGFYKGAPLEAVTEWLDEHGVLYFNYADEVSAAEMDWNLKREFKDREHLNFRGSLRLSADLAEQLAWETDLADHRGEVGCEQWDEDWRAFSEEYEEQIHKALGDEYCAWWEAVDSE